MPTNNTITTPHLVAQLRSTAADHGDVVCIDLLAAEGYWWTRDDFIIACVTWSDDVPVFDPAEAINFAHIERKATESQRAFLRLALSFTLLYEVAFYDTIPLLDRLQLALVLNGVTRTATVPPPINVDGSLAARLPIEVAP